MPWQDEHTGQWTDGDTAIDPVWLSRIIGEIYDCALDPLRWRAVIETIANRFSFISGTLSVIQLGPYSHQVTVHHQIDEAWLAAMAGYIEASIEIWGGANRVGAFPLGEPVVCSEVRPPEEWPRFAYYRDILEPRGMIDSAVIGLVRDRNAIGYLGLNRHASSGPIQPDQIEGLRLVAPHMRRAVTISNLFDLKAVEVSTFQSVLDAMACAVVLVDGDLGIMHANQRARGMLAARDLMQDARGRLSVSGQVAADALRVAVAIASRDEAHMSQRGIGIPVTGRSGAPAAVHVLPLERRLVRSHLHTKAVAAVFAVTSAAHAPIDLVATLYALTPAETQLLAALCRGETLDQAAGASSITMSTAKTHLKRVFSKTGCARQAEVVALVAKFAIGF